MVWAIENRPERSSPLTFAIFISSCLTDNIRNFLGISDAALHPVNDIHASIIDTLQGFLSHLRFPQYGLKIVESHLDD